MVEEGLDCPEAVEEELIIATVVGGLELPAEGKEELPVPKGTVVKLELPALADRLTDDELGTGELEVA